MRKQLSDKYIRGHGIEIGGLHAPLPVLPGCIVDYVDRPEVRTNHSDVMPAGYAFIEDDAERLATFNFDSLDFIIANHVLEHCHDPLGTLIVWANRLYKGGIVYCALPEKNHTFDKPRAITELSHLAKDLENMTDSGSTDDQDHYREWFSKVDNFSGPALEQKIEECSKARTNIHFHVWDYAAMKEMFNYEPISHLFEIVEGAVNGSEVIWVLRKK